MHKTISVLGCGWLGLPLAKDLVASGYRVKGSTRSLSKINTLAAAGIEPFVVTIDTVDQSMNDFLQSGILIIDITSKDILHFNGLLMAIERSPVEKVIFVSSTSVYPALNKIVTEETKTDDQFNPLVGIEDIFLNSTKLKVTIIRFAGLFGYDRKPGNFFRSGKTVPDSEGFVNMMHRDDCIAMITAVLTQEAWGEIFNGCADSHPTKREFYTKAAKDIGMPEPTFEKNATTTFKIVSNNKMKEHLGFVCTFNDLMTINFASC